jgi:hypothetical protein
VGSDDPGRARKGLAALRNFEPTSSRKYCEIENQGFDIIARNDYLREDASNGTQESPAVKKMI